MDVQRKKGILEVCVLAVLKKGPSYGYMIIRDLEQCVEISESTLYPILKRLEQSGSLTTYRCEYNGRMRKYYQLTSEGQRKIDSFLDEWDELQQMYRFIEEQNQMEAPVTGQQAEAEEVPGTAEQPVRAEEVPETAEQPAGADPASANPAATEPAATVSVSAEPAATGSAAEPISEEPAATESVSEESASAGQEALNSQQEGTEV